jgi:hypothetical protein
MNQSDIKPNESLESPYGYRVINVSPINEEIFKNQQIIFQSNTKFKSKYCGDFSLNHYCVFNSLYFKIFRIFIIVLIIILCVAFIPRH